MLRKIGNPLQSLLLLLFRAFWGYQFAISGFGKFLNYRDIVDAFQSWGIMYPKYAVGVIGGLEFVFGVFLIFGLFTRFSALVLFLVMVGAFFTADKDALMGLVQHFDYMPVLNSTPFPFALAMVILFAFGPGKIALDYVRGGFNKTKEMP
ncbi:MAG: DoxX family protein [Verrucomicrobia bacterium]|nr:DoxX family protein [Verrucomicrobiota bacterium]